MIFSKEHLQKIETQHRKSPEVERFIAKRDKLLKNQSHLKEFQDEVDNLLSTTIDPMRRLEILFMLMTDSLTEMRAVFSELVTLAHTAMVFGDPE
jgi:hypothetical protein